MTGKNQFGLTGWDIVRKREEATPSVEKGAPSVDYKHARDEDISREGGGREHGMQCECNDVSCAICEDERRQTQRRE